MPVIIDPLESFIGTAYDLHHCEFNVPDYLIEPIVPYAGKMMIQGETAAGKTQVAIDLMLSVITGGLWLDRFKCVQGNVLYLSLEDLSTIELRQKMVAGTKHLSEAEQKRLHIHLHHTGFDIFDPSDPIHKEIEEKCDLIKPLLVVTDPISACHTFSMNEKGIARPVWGAWRRIIGGAIICGVHHEKQDNPNPKITVPDKDMMSGSKEWIDFLNLGVRVVNIQGKSMREISFPKSRNNPEVEKLTIEFFLNPDTMLPELKMKSAEKMWVRRKMQEKMPREMIIAKLQDGSMGRKVPSGTFKDWLVGYDE